MTSNSGVPAAAVTNCVLFYSHQCPHCRDVLHKLRESGLEHEFDRVDVLTDPVPAGVTSVPTVYEKRTCKLHEGAQVFELLARMEEAQVTGYELRTHGRDAHIAFSDLDFTASHRGDAYSWIQDDA